MRLDSKDEKEAFEFICELASELTGRRGCNDLNPPEKQKFKHLKVIRGDVYGKKVEENITFDFDVIHWLKAKIED